MGYFRDITGNVSDAIVAYKSSKTYDAANLIESAVVAFESAHTIVNQTQRDCMINANTFLQ